MSNRACLNYVKETDYVEKPSGKISSLKLGKGPLPKHLGVAICDPKVRLPHTTQSKVEAAVRRVMRKDERFRRLKMTPQLAVITSWLLNEMLEAHPSVHAQMIHPTHGQFDSTAMEAARSFVRSFAARHRIPGVKFDKAYYK